MRNRFRLCGALWFGMLFCSGLRSEGQQLPKPEETGDQLPNSRNESDNGDVVYAGIFEGKCTLVCTPNLDLAYVASDGLLQKILLPRMKEERRLQFDRALGSLWQSREGLVLLTRAKGSATQDARLWIIDPATLAIKKTITTPGVVHGAVVPGTSYLLTVNGSAKHPGGKDLLRFVDLKTGKTAHEWTADSVALGLEKRVPEEKRSGPALADWEDLRVSPDGNWLFARPGAGSLHRFRINGTDLTYEEIGPHVLGSGEYSISSDSARIAITARTDGTPKGSLEEDLYGIFIYKCEDLQKPVATLKDAEFVGFQRDHHFVARRLGARKGGVLVPCESSGDPGKIFGFGVPEEDSELVKTVVDQCFMHPQGQAFLVRHGPEVRIFQMRKP